jgi:hypothetical protein
VADRDDGESGAVFVLHIPEVPPTDSDTVMEL